MQGTSRVFAYDHHLIDKDDPTHYSNQRQRLVTVVIEKVRDVQLKHFH